MKSLNQAIITLSLGVLIATPTFAQESVSGSVVSVCPPPSVVGNQYVSNSELRVFCEAKDFALPNDVTVNISLPGSYEGSSPSLTPTTLQAGTKVNSYFLHFDNSNGGRLQGSVTFAGEILGLIVATPELDSSDSLSQATTVYPTGTDYSRRVMTNESGDQVSFQDDKKTLEVNLIVGSSFLDQIRILTVPTDDDMCPYF